MTKSVAVPDEVVMNKIYLIRGQKVMLDRDLAELYGVKAKGDLRSRPDACVYWFGFFSEISPP